MSPRTLWNIILKTFGIYIFIQILYSLPQIFSVFTFFEQPYQDPGRLLAFSYTLFITSMYFFMLIAFVFRTDWLIDALGLLKTMGDAKIDINIHRSVVLKVVIIVTGLLIFFENLTGFAENLFRYYQQMKIYQTGPSFAEATRPLIYSTCELLVGIFMFSGSRLIVNFIELKRRGRPKPQPSSSEE